MNNDSLISNWTVSTSENVLHVLSNWTRSTTENGLNVLQPEVRKAMVDKDTSELVQDIIYCGLLPVLTLLGTTGNILSIIVLIAQGLKESTNIFLLALTASDTVYLLTTGIRRVGCIVGKFNPRLGHNFYMVTLPQLKVIAVIFSRFTGVITMLISVERCIAVTRPMKVKLWFVSRRVRIMVIVIFVVTFALFCPTFLTMELKWMTDPRTNLPFAYVSLTQFYKTNIVSLNWYLNVFLTIMFRFVPVIFIFTSSITIIIALKKASSFQKSSSSARNDKVSKVNKMMLTICVAYVLFNIPASIHQVLVLIFPQYNLNGSEKDLFQLISAFGQLTELVNSAWNFIIYFALSEKFSRTLKRVLFGRCCPSLVPPAVTSVSGQTGESYATVTKVKE